MQERGVLDGYPDGKFYPNSQVTRAEFAKIMTVAAGLVIEEPTRQIFSDVAVNEWYAPYIHAAQTYLSAYNQNGSLYYRPNTPALREDIAVALVKLKGYSTLGADLTTISRMFTDYQTISSDAQKYVAAAVENGLVSGYDDGTFRGQSGITRAEAAAMLWRAYQYGDENKSYDTTQTTNSSEIKTVTYPSTDSNIQPTAVPTEKPIIDLNLDITDTEETPKPYVMKKLAAANVADNKKMTFDGDDSIFYIDSSDGAVYEISVSSGNKNKYMTTSKLKLEKTEAAENDDGDETTKAVIAEYTSFVPSQIFYDTLNDKLLLIGYYENVSEPYSSPKSKQKYMVIYDITDGDDNLYCEIGGNEVINFLTALNSETAVVNDRDSHYTSTDKTYILDIESGNLQTIKMRGETLSYIKSGSDLYSYSGKEVDALHGIYQYDFSKDKSQRISEEISNNSLGIKNECFYFWSKKGNVYKISVKTGKSTILDINTNSENVEFEDMGNMNNIMESFFIVDDNTLIFYDTSMSAFRILMENE